MEFVIEAQQFSSAWASEMLPILFRRTTLLRDKKSGERARGIPAVGQRTDKREVRGPEGRWSWTKGKTAKQKVERTTKGRIVGPMPVIGRCAEPHTI